jgi:hypothetical protein
LVALGPDGSSRVVWMIIGMINWPRWQDRRGSRMIVRGSRRLVPAVLIPLLLAAACAQPQTQERRPP